MVALLPGLIQQTIKLSPARRPLAGFAVITLLLLSPAVMPQDDARVEPSFPENTANESATEQITEAAEQNSAAQVTTSPGNPAAIPVKETAAESDYEQVLLDKNKFEQLVMALESNSTNDAFSPELVEAYLGLGSALRRLELYDQSMTALDKALQSTRVTNGLDSLEQIPILEEMGLIHEAQAGWEEFDNDLHLINYIASKNYLPGDRNRLQWVNNLAQWKLKSAREALVSAPFNNVSDTIALYEKEIKKLENTDFYQGKNIDLASLQIGEAEAAYEMAKLVYERPLNDYNTGTQRTVTQRQCFPTKLSNGRIIMVCQMVEVPDLNYYIDPANNKNTDISRNLKKMKDSLIKAYQLLQFQAEDEQQQLALLEQAQSLTLSYNDFVNGSSNRKN